MGWVGLGSLGEERGKEKFNFCIFRVSLLLIFNT